MPAHHQSQKGGLTFVLSAYCAWGILTLYWRLLAAVPAYVIVMHRVVWSLIFISMLLFREGRLKQSFKDLAHAPTFKGSLLSAALLTANWLTFVWAAGNGRIIEAGLGYIICPLVSLALAAIFLGEKLGRNQKVAMLIMFPAVLAKTILYGELPWVAIILALTFAFYGLVRKKQARDPLLSFFHELLIAFPVVLGVVLALEPGALFVSHGITADLLLPLSGPITALPMLWLLKGLRSVPLHLNAICQFISPTLTILTGLLCGERIGNADLILFAVIWLAVGIYLWNALVNAGRQLAVMLSRDSRKRVPLKSGLPTLDVLAPAISHAGRQRYSNQGGRDK